METNRSIIFYDGDCVLCHGVVKFVLRHDKKTQFYFSPLQGETVKKLISQEQIQAAGDTLIVRAFAGEIFLRSDGVIFILKRLGLFWRLLGSVLKLFPGQVRDLGYRGVAAIRKQIFGTTSGICPLLTPELRERILP